MTPESQPDLPLISIIIPTLNVEAILDNCLASIRRQTYPQDRIEILLADAMSKDRTREIAARHGATVLDDRGNDMEDGKRMAVNVAKGEMIVFIDTDNEITHPDYLELAVRALRDNPQAFGVEGYYLPSAKMSSFCAYITHRLHISDPVCWIMSANPQLQERTGEVERWKLPAGTFCYPLGANGFVYRRADLAAAAAGEYFQDTHVALYLMQHGKPEWLRIRGRGVHHYYVQTLWEFMRKRRRSVVRYLQVQQERPVDWMKENPVVPLWAAALYCGTVIGPAWHALRGVVRDRDWCWLWHPPACFVCVLGNLWGMWTFRRRGHNRKLTAELKAGQKLKQ